MESEEALSHRAEIFRSKLIEDFQILEGISEAGRRKAPVYNSSDVTSEPLAWNNNYLLFYVICYIIFLSDPQILEKILLENPDQMVKFKAYQREALPDASIIDRRLTRVKNKNRLPVGVWAHWVVESISIT